MRVNMRKDVRQMITPHSIFQFTSGIRIRIVSFDLENTNENLKIKSTYYSSTILRLSASESFRQVIIFPTLRYVALSS